jgi:glucose-1-phosphate adenylyltransferase
VRQYAWLLDDTKNRSVKNVVILSGDHLYRMDYMRFVQHHIETAADITIGCIPYEEGRASDFGLMKIDKAGRVTEFAEKPKGDALKAMAVDTRVLGLSNEEAARRPYIASMGARACFCCWAVFVVALICFERCIWLPVPSSCLENKSNNANSNHNPKPN